jgi:hypothetical protein
MPFDSNCANPRGSLVIVRNAHSNNNRTKFLEGVDSLNLANDNLFGFLINNCSLDV